MCDNLSVKIFPHTLHAELSIFLSGASALTLTSLAAVLPSGEMVATISATIETSLAFFSPCDKTSRLVEALQRWCFLLPLLYLLVMNEINCYKMETACSLKNKQTLTPIDQQGPLKMVANSKMSFIFFGRSIYFSDIVM